MMDGSTCKSVKSSLWDYTAGSLEAEVHEMVEAHLVDCRDCNLHRAEVRSMRTGLRSLPQKAISPLLATRLQVIASRELSRQNLKRDLKARLAEWGSRLKLEFDNLLRPLAVPAAGGLLASVLCFGVIVDSLHVRLDRGLDIPVGLYTEVAIDELSPFGNVSNDIIVQLTVDANGKVIDFSPFGQTSPDQMKEIGNLVLYSTFKPATSFGQRVSGKVLVDIHHINVRG